MNWTKLKAKYGKQLLAVAGAIFAAVLGALAQWLGAPAPEPVVVEKHVEKIVFKDAPGTVAPHADGWIADPDEVQAVADTLPIKVFGDTPAGQIQELPKFHYCWKHYEQLFARPPPIKDQGSVGSCFPMNTQILMADGTERSIQDIAPGNMVVTHNRRSRPVTELMRRLYTGPMYTVHVKGWKYPLTLTAEHPVAVITNLQKKTNGYPFVEGPLAWMKADTLRVGDRVIVSPGADDQPRRESVTVSDYLDERYVSDDGALVRNPNAPYGSEVRNHIELTPEMAKFIGLYLAEGGNHKNASGKPGGPQFTFHRKETELHELAVRGLDSLFGVASRIEMLEGISRVNTAKVRAENSTLGEFLIKFCGDGVYEKHVPESFFHASPEAKLELIRGWLAGDGHKSRLVEGKNRSLQSLGVTASKRLHRDMFRLAVSIGLAPGTSIRKQEAHQRVASRSLNFYSQDCIRVHPEQADCAQIAKIGVESGHAIPHALGQLRRIEKIEVKHVVDEPVFNFEVEEDHSYVAEGIVVHNCVSFGTNTAVERTLAGEIVRRKGSIGEWSRFTEEATYGGSRFEIGGNRIRGDGSIGAWAAQFVTKYGMVPRRKYDGVDLTTYSESLCRDWGRNGVPDAFEAVARKFPVKSFVQVKVWEECKAAIAQDYCVQVASNQGFANRRDENGVARASGSWAHSMCIDGYHIEGTKEYGHIVNSWGTSWISGPVGWGNPNPDGFWAEASVIDRMLRQGDSWAFSGVTGFERRKPLDWDVLAEPRRPRDRLALRPEPSSVSW